MGKRSAYITYEIWSAQGTSNTTLGKGRVNFAFTGKFTGAIFDEMLEVIKEEIQKGFKGPIVIAPTYTYLFEAEEE